MNYNIKDNKEQLAMININYSQKLVNDVKILSGKLGAGSDEELISWHERYYLDPSPHINRLKYSIFSIEDVNKSLKTDANILEIGAGIGTNCILMKALTEASVVGIEPAPESFHNLKECISDFKNMNKRYPYEAVNASGESVPYEDETFDFIYSFEVM